MPLFSQSGIFGDDLRFGEVCHLAGGQRFQRTDVVSLGPGRRVVAAGGSLHNINRDAHVKNLAHASIPIAATAEIPR